MTQPTVDMTEVKEIFTDSFQLCTSLLSNVTHDEIHDFITNISARLRPHAFIMDDGIEEITNSIFSQEIILDFVMSLNFQFFARWGRIGEGVTSLTYLLSVAMTQPTKGDSVLIPKAYSDRFNTTEEMRKLLDDNHWFIIVCLIRLFIVANSSTGSQTPED